jgi:hypothetical protein
MTELFPREPQRLLDEPTDVGELLRQTVQLPPRDRATAAGWERLMAAQVRRHRVRRMSMYGGALAAAAAVALFIGRGVVTDSPSIGREPLAQGTPVQGRPGDAAQESDERREATAEQAPGAQRFKLSGRERAPVTASPSAAPSATPPTSSAPSGDPASLPASNGPAPSAALEPAKGADTSRCAALARGGDFQGAVGCYDRIAAGAGVGAELALYEKARLEARGLGNKSAALRTLSQHQARFGSGSLATEVAMTRIELLVGTGQHAGALTAIDQALGSRAGRERGGDLHALKGDLLRRSGECMGALHEYAAAEASGVHPSRLAAGRAACGNPSPAGSADAAPPAGSAREPARP